jgi:mediator of RNA polymerase II transcription subunit 7
MAEDGQQRAVTAAFPPPPPFWKYFSAANIQKLEEIKEASAKRSGERGRRHWSPSELRELDVPPELRFLIPPEIPRARHYSVFSEIQSVCHSQLFSGLSLCDILC